MPTAAQVKALVRSHADGDEQRFYSIALQVAAQAARQAHNRFAIDLRDLIDRAKAGMDRPKAGQVTRPVPMVQPRGELADWEWGRYTPALFDHIRGLDRVLVTARVSQHWAPTFLDAGQVYSEQLVVVASASQRLYSILQSRVHESWFRFFGSSLEERPRYTPSDCFETFPFPQGWESTEPLERVGRDYYDFRAALMVRSNEGLIYEQRPDASFL